MAKHYGEVISCMKLQKQRLEITFNKFLEGEGADLVWFFWTVTILISFELKLCFFLNFKFGELLMKRNPPIVKIDCGRKYFGNTFIL